MNRSADLTESAIDDAVRRVCQGDQAYFEVVVRRFERPLRAWLAVQASPGVDVDEIAQRAFVAAFARLSDYQPGTDFAAWLFAIAHFQLKTELTRLRRIADYRSRYAPDLLHRELERHGVESPELVQARLEQLRKCLDDLSEQLRRFVSWRYDEGISLEEMSLRSGRSVAAVKKQLWILRRRLQACVESRLAAEGEM